MVALQGMPPAAPVGVWDWIHALVVLAGAFLMCTTTLVLGGLLAHATYQFVRIVRSILRGDIIL
jgi:hypothetical protein